MQLVTNTSVRNFVIDSDIIAATINIIPDILCLLSESLRKVNYHPTWLMASLKQELRPDLWQDDCITILYLPAMSSVVINGIIHKVPEDPIRLNRLFYVNKEYLPNCTVLVLKNNNKLEITLSYQDKQKTFSTIKHVVCLL